MRTLILLLIPVFLFAGDYKKTTYTKNGQVKYSIVQNQDGKTVEIPGRDVFDIGRVDFIGAAKKLIELDGQIPIEGKGGRIIIVDVPTIQSTESIEQVSSMLEANYNIGSVGESVIVEPIIIDDVIGREQQKEKVLK